MPGPEASQKGPPVVLLVDDEPLILESLGQELGAMCRLYTASSAAEAELRLAARRYDAIVCDHMLPGEQGLDFLVRAMEMVPSTRRILVTGYMKPEMLRSQFEILEEPEDVLSVDISKTPQEIVELIRKEWKV